MNEANSKSSISPLKEKHLLNILSINKGQTKQIHNNNLFDCNNNDSYNINKSNTETIL